MKVKALLNAGLLLLLSAGFAHAGCKKFTCDDCSEECLKNPYKKGCPPICKSPECQTSCDDCSAECKKNPYKKGCPDICKDIECQSCSDCSDECKKHPDGKECPDICKDIKCYTCDDCSAECLKHPEGKDCPPACADLNCNICDKVAKDCPAACGKHGDSKKCPDKCKDVPEECLLPATCDDCSEACKDDPDQEGCLEICKDPKCRPEPLPIRFIGDLGYYHESDPADYLFGRIGAEYAFNNHFSVLGMIGVAPQIKGDDGDDALLLDVIAQYNWSRLFVGVGLGGWITSGDVDDDSGDSDLDFIANIGGRIYGEPDKFNMSLFLEARSAVDEFDSIAEYGRFGAGLRFKF